MEHRKRRKSFNTPHHAHALTFSVYRRRPYLTLPGVAEAFLARLDAARRKRRFEVWAYCVMPDHAHVVVNPLEEVYAMATILKAIKSPSATDFFAMYPHLREEFRAGGDPLPHGSPLRSCLASRGTLSGGRRVAATIGTCLRRGRPGRRFGTCTT